MNDASIDELMAQFRELESGLPEKHIVTDCLSRSPKSAYLPSSSAVQSFGKTNDYFPFQSSWKPLLMFAGGLFVWTILVISIFRPRFLYNEEEQFLWKRFFTTILVTFLFLMTTVVGLYWYLTGKWILFS